jgi:hypothetical protein
VAGVSLHIAACQLTKLTTRLSHKQPAWHGEQRHAGSARRTLAGLSDYLNRVGLNIVGFDRLEEAKQGAGFAPPSARTDRSINPVLWLSVLEKGSRRARCVSELRDWNFNPGAPFGLLDRRSEEWSPCKCRQRIRQYRREQTSGSEAAPSEQRLLDARVELTRLTLGKLTASITREVDQPHAGIDLHSTASADVSDRPIDGGFFRGLLERGVRDRGNAGRCWLMMWRKRRSPNEPGIRRQ